MNDETPESDIAGLPHGDEAALRRGLGRIHSKHRHRICAWLRTRYPGLPPEDLADAWGDTLVGVVRAVRGGRFDPGRPLLPFLMTIAYRRAADLARRARGYVRLADGPGLEPATVPASQQARRDAVETLAAVRAEIPRLPERQRIVLGAFVDGYPDTRRVEELRARIRRISGTPVTAEAVKGALREARKKIRIALSRSGHAVGERGGR